MNVFLWQMNELDQKEEKSEIKRNKNYRYMFNKCLYIWWIFNEMSILYFKLEIRNIYINRNLIRIEKKIFLFIFSNEII